MSDTLKVSVCKMTHATNHFNANQKVWLQDMSGAQAAKVVGKHRGKGRYVSAWIKWDTDAKPFPEWKTFEMPEAFVKQHQLLKRND